MSSPPSYGKKRNASYKPSCSSDPNYNKSKITNRKKINFLDLKAQPGDGRFRIDYDRKIGEGGFGQVFLASDKQNPDIPLVAKLITKANVSERSLKQEIEIGEMIEHPNLVSIIYYEYDDDIYMIFSNYFQGGDLSDYLHNLGGKFSDCLAFLIFHQIAVGVEYLHKHNIAHLDLKLENAVFSNEEEMKVALIDFGLSKIVDRTGMLSGYRGTMGYLPVEVMDNYDESCKYDPYKVDVFSLGVMLYVMLTGRFPFDEVRGEHKKKNMKETKLYKEMKALPEAVFERLNRKGHPESLSVMIRGMLEPSWKKRWSLQDVKRSPYFKLMSKEIKSSDCPGVESPSYERQTPTTHLRWINLQSSPQRFSDSTELLHKCNLKKQTSETFENEIERILKSSERRQNRIQKLTKEALSSKNGVVTNIEKIEKVRNKRRFSKESPKQRLSSDEVIVNNLKKRYKKEKKNFENWGKIMRSMLEERDRDLDFLDENLAISGDEELSDQLQAEEDSRRKFMSIYKETYSLLQREMMETSSLLRSR